MDHRKEVRGLEILQISFSKPENHSVARLVQRAPDTKHGGQALLVRLRLWKLYMADFWVVLAFFGFVSTALFAANLFRNAAISPGKHGFDDTVEEFLLFFGHKYYGWIW